MGFFVSPEKDLNGRAALPKVQMKRRSHGVTAPIGAEQVRYAPPNYFKFEPSENAIYKRIVRI
jgi:hypothetical protein